MFRRYRFLLVLLIALLAVPLSPRKAHALPAAGWVIVGGIAYMTAAFWWIVYSMRCADCSFRGAGDGGSF